jgi:hypothetical protein
MSREKRKGYMYTATDTGVRHTRQIKASEKLGLVQNATKIIWEFCIYCGFNYPVDVRLW